MTSNRNSNELPAGKWLRARNFNQRREEFKDQGLQIPPPRVSTVAYLTTNRIRVGSRCWFGWPPVLWQARFARMCVGAHCFWKIRPAWD